jgi:hypothetical protein
MTDELLTKSELARKILRDMFAKRSRITIAEAVAAAAEAGIGRKTLTEARKAIGATEIHNGPHPGFWQAPRQS